jgi:two-component system, NarL family, sensor kinase
MDNKLGLNARLDIDPGFELSEEAEQTLDAIRRGTVDAFVVEESEGNRVYALESSDLPYSALVERMHQGAAMLDHDGTMIYSNHALADLLGVPREDLIGRALQGFVSNSATYERLLSDCQSGPCEGEMTLQCRDGSIPANFSFTVLSRDKSTTGVLVTDLRQQKEQADFAARIQALQDEERKRIARELHDSAGQLLSAIGINLSVLRKQAQKMDSAAMKAVSDSEILLDQVTSEIRTISHLLHPPLLDAVGLVSALRWYVDGFAERSKITVDLQIAEDIGRFNEEVEIAIFRIIQECLTNVHRHSGSKDAFISLHRNGDRLLVKVQDSGKGIPMEKRRELTEKGRGGIGFIGMRERLRQFGGSLDVQSQESRTVVTATLKVA